MAFHDFSDTLTSLSNDDLSRLHATGLSQQEDTRSWRCVMASIELEMLKRDLPKPEQVVSRRYASWKSDHYVSGYFLIQDPNTGRYAVSTYDLRVVSQFMEEEDATILLEDQYNG